MDKGKGIVYDFEKRDKDGRQANSHHEGQKPMDSAIRSGRAMTRVAFNCDTQSEIQATVSQEVGSSFQGCSTVFTTSIHLPSSSRTSLKNKKPRKRPDKKSRKPKPKNEKEKGMVKKRNKDLCGWRG